MFNSLLFVVVLICSTLLAACGSQDTSNGSSGGGNGSNSTPVAYAGNPFTTEVGKDVTLNGSGTDPDGDNLTYEWRLTDSPSTSAATLLNATSNTPDITPDVAGTYVAELTVSDGVAKSAPSAVSFTAVTGNVPPIADAGADQSVVLGNQVTLDGSGSSDPNGDALSYTWSFVSRPAGSSAPLSNAGSSSPKLTPDVSGEYVIQLIVNDGGFDSMPSTTKVFAAAFSVTLSWAANTDSPPGYVIYAGPTATTATTLVRVLVKGDSSWKPSAPSVSIDGGTILRATGGSSQACFSIKAYNGVGKSSASDTTCLTVPAP